MCHLASRTCRGSAHLHYVDVSIARNESMGSDGVDLAFSSVPADGEVYGRDVVLHGSYVGADGGEFVEEVVGKSRRERAVVVFGVVVVQAPEVSDIAAIDCAAVAVDELSQLELIEHFLEQGSDGAIECQPFLAYNAFRDVGGHSLTACGGEPGDAHCFLPIRIRRPETSVPAPPRRRATRCRAPGHLLVWPAKPTGRLAPKLAPPELGLGSQHEPCLSTDPCAPKRQEGHVHVCEVIPPRRRGSASFTHDPCCRTQ